MTSTPGYAQHAVRPRARAAAPLVTGGGLLAGAAAVALVDPSENGFFPACPFHAITGLWCPGCGMTRATHHLLHGDVTTALHYNVLVVFVLALIGSVWAVWYLESSGRPVPRALRPPPWLSTTGVVIAIAFAIVRNLPGVSGLRG